MHPKPAASDSCPSWMFLPSVPPKLYKLSITLSKVALRTDTWLRCGLSLYILTGVPKPAHPLILLHSWTLSADNEGEWGDPQLWTTDWSALSHSEIAPPLNFSMSTLSPGNPDYPNLLIHQLCIWKELWKILYFHHIPAFLCYPAKPTSKHLSMFIPFQLWGL